MAFQGIDPDGLNQLSTQTRLAAARPAMSVRPGLWILSQRGCRADAASLQALCDRVSTWGDETAATLHWRAELIRSGQDSPDSMWATLVADYAATAVFPDADPEQALGDWLESREHVDTAVADITRWLDQRWNDWDVTNNDLQNIATTLTGLSADELDEVIAALSPRQLERWIEEMGHSINGFSRAEKQELFTHLSTNASGESLGKIHDAVLAGGSEETLVDLGTAIGYVSPDQVIVDFVDYVMAADLAGHRYSTVAPALAIAGIGSSAAAADVTRKVVATDGALRLIIVDSLIAERGGSDDLLTAVVGTMCRGTDTAAIAAAFTIIADVATDPDQLHTLLDRRDELETIAPHGPGHIPPNEDAATVLLRSHRDVFLTDSMSLLLADANAVITELATMLDPEGIITTSFLYQLVARERFDDVGRISHALRGGDAVDPLRFAGRGPDPDYPFSHAQNLAYLAGNLINAFARYADDAKGQIGAIAFAANAVTGLLAPFFEIGNKAVEAIVGSGVGIDAVANDTQSDIAGFLERLERNTEKALQPEEDNTITAAEGDLAWQAWMSRFRAVTADR